MSGPGYDKISLSSLSGLSGCLCRPFWTRERLRRPTVYRCTSRLSALSHMPYMLPGGAIALHKSSVMMQVSQHFQLRPKGSNV